MYKKIIGHLLFQMVYFFGIAQVGIGTTNPQGALDVTSTTDGLLIPRVALVDTATPVVDTPTQSELVFNTTTSGTAPNQVTPGFYYWNGTVWVKILSSDAVTGGWNLTGNSGTTDATNFMGTIDDVPLNFRVNNQNSGKIKSNGETFLGYQAGINNTSTSSTGIGFQSLYNHTYAFANTAVGYNSLFSLVDSNHNTAIGYQVLYNNLSYGNTGLGSWALIANTSGYDNTAIGKQSMYNNTSGWDNTAVGALSLYRNQTGISNVAIGLYSLGNATHAGSVNSAVGKYAMYNNSGSSNSGFGAYSLYWNGADRNTAVGYYSLYSNTSGSDNVSSGYYSMRLNTTGTGHAAMGANSLEKNTTGNRNSAFGSDAMNNTTTGSNNVAIGSQSLYNLTTGIGNTALGFQSGNSGTALLTGNFNTLLGYTPSVDNSARTNTIAIAGNGNLALGGDNRVRIGNNAMTSIGGQVGWTTISDQRVKQNIQQDVKGLDFLLKLKPVTYNYSVEQSNQIQKATIAEDWPSKHNVEKIRFSGFLAQDVQKTAREVGYDFSGVDQPEDADGLWGLRYAEFTVPLVKAVQELHEKNQALEQKNDQLQEQLNLLSARFQRLEQQVKP